MKLILWFHKRINLLRFENEPKLALTISSLYGTKRIVELPDWAKSRK